MSIIEYAMILYSLREYNIVIYLKWNTVDVQLFTVMNMSISSTWIINGKGFMVTWHCILLEKYCVQSSSSVSSAKENKHFLVLKK